MRGFSAGTSAERLQIGPKNGATDARFSMGLLGESWVRSLAGLPSHARGHWFKSSIVHHGNQILAGRATEPAPSVMPVVMPASGRARASNWSTLGVNPGLDLSPRLGAASAGVTGGATAA